MSKVKAFTILEMLVNLTIMSIIMGMIYFAYSSFVQQVIGYQKSVQEQNELTSSCVQLKMDFYTAEKVVKNDKKFTVVFYDVSKKVSYNFTDKYLIRKQLNMLDTLAVEELKVEVQKNEITNEDLVKTLRVKTRLFDEPMEFVIHKTYAPNIVLKL